MTRFYGAHPALIAFFLAGGATLGLYFGYQLYDEVLPSEKANSEYALTVAWLWIITIAGTLLYLIGGVLYGRSRGLNGFLSFLLHLLPVIGLILMTIMGRRLTPHDLWQRQNPGLDEKTLKRNYRTMKPLY